MFGISFSELLLVALVALLVLGPERLPGAARTAGLWVGRLKRSFAAIRTDIEREIGAHDLRRQLHDAQGLTPMSDGQRRPLDRLTLPAAPAEAAAAALAEPATDQSAYASQLRPTCVASVADTATAPLEPVVAAPTRAVAEDASEAHASRAGRLPIDAPAATASSSPAHLPAPEGTP